MTSSASRHYSAHTNSRRGSPAEGQSHGFFATGQGGRPILPPISDFANLSRFPVPPAYNTPYTQPRSANRLGYDITPAGFFPTPPYTSAGSSPQFSPAYATFEERPYSPQPYPAYTTTRVSTPPLVQPPVDTRRQLPPLSTSPGPTNERWQQNSYMQPTPAYPATNIRSPAASYPAPYLYPSTSNSGNTYAYHMPQDHISLHGPFDDVSRMEHPRSSSPYRPVTQASFPPPPPTPPPVSPTSPEEPTIKKKRKRADAAQLKVLNETYARTAFPSTEERIALAKMLDMSARSVQIWFQNKRQSMRQTNRQSTNNTAANSHHPYALANQAVDHMADNLGHHSSAYDASSTSMGGPLYLTGPSNEPVSRSHGSHSHSHYTSSSHRHSSRDQGDYHSRWSRQ